MTTWMTTGISGSTELVLERRLVRW